MENEPEQINTCTWRAVIHGVEWRIVDQGRMHKPSYCVRRSGAPLVDNRGRERRWRTITAAMKAIVAEGALR